MTKKRYDFAVYIDSFQVLQEEQIKNINYLLTIADHVVLMLEGSIQARNINEPFTFAERKAVINEVFINGAISIMPLRKYPYSKFVKLTAIQSCVSTLSSHHNVADAKIGYIAPNSLDKAGYADLHWVQIAIEPTVKNDKFLPLWYTGKLWCIDRLLPEPVLSNMREFTKTPEFKVLCDEHELICKYKASWENAPYPPTFVTTDAVVIQAGHILLIKRKSAPGEGTWALPGGFLNPGEWILEGMLRELLEETRIKVPEKVLRGSIVSSHTFDDPDRSLRGRTITHAFLIVLNAIGSLPVVKGCDDAIQAKWFTFAEVAAMSPVMFEDHGHIIEYFLSRSN